MGMAHANLADLDAWLRGIGSNRYGGADDARGRGLPKKLASLHDALAFENDLRGRSGIRKGCVFLHMAIVPVVFEEMASGLRNGSRGGGKIKVRAMMTRVPK